MLPLTFIICSIRLVLFALPMWVIGMVKDWEYYEGRRKRIK